MKSKRGVMSAIVYALVIILLVGCSGGNNTSNNQNVEKDNGEQAGEQGTAPITFDLYVNFPWFALDWKDPAAKKITEATGVSLNISKPVTDDDQKLNIM